MLAASLAAIDAPGSNPARASAGPAWIYALPRLERGDAGIVGGVSPATMALLRRTAASIVPLGPGQPTATAGSLDLVVVGKTTERAVDADVVAGLSSALRPDGVVFVTPAAGGDSIAAAIASLPAGGGFDTPLRLALRPVGGEATLVAPASAVDLLDRLEKGAAQGAGRGWRAMLRWRSLRPALRFAVGSGRGRFALVLRRTAAGTAARPADDAVTERDAPDRPPDWMLEAARAAATDARVADLEAMRWAVSAGGVYETQKVLVVLAPAARSEPAFVVKLVRGAQHNARLEREASGIDLVHAVLGEAARARVPERVFQARVGGAAALCETAIEGRPFRAVTTGRPDDRFARDALDWLAALGVGSAAPASGHAVAAALTDLLARLGRTYTLEPDVRRFLEERVNRLSGEPTVPTVLQHGDAGVWNALVRADGRVAFLDWEAHDPLGLPLWDSLYFLRSFVVSASRRPWDRDRVAVAGRAFWQRSGWSELAIATVRRYRAALGLSAAATECIFYGCWAHRALKEAARLPAERLAKGHYVRLLEAAVEHRASPVMDRLFGWVE